VPTFRKIVIFIAVLALISLANVAPSAALQQSPTARRAPASAGSRPLPGQCLHPSKATEALSQLLDTIADHPTAGAYNSLGALFAQEGLEACAISSFEIALHFDPKNYEARYNLAIALMKRGDRAHAAEELHTVIAETPDSASAHHALGALLEDESKLPEATAEYQAALDADPHFPFGAVDLARVLTSQQKFDDAISALEAALKRSPSVEENVSLESALGAAYAQSGNLAKAIATLRQLASDHPDSARAHLGLGTVLAQQEGTSADAITEFREALRLDPNVAPAKLALGRVLLDRKKYSDALPLLQEYIESQPNDAQGYHFEGLTYEGLEQWDKAGEALRNAAHLAPDDYEIRKDLALALVQAGRADEAIHEFVAAEKISPNEPEVHEQLAGLYEKKGALALAKTERAKYAALAGQHEHNAEAGKLNDQASKLYVSGDSRAAEELYRKALVIVPDDAQMHYNLALALAHLGDQPGEIQELERAVQLDPQLAVAHNQLGLLALTAGRQDEAESELKSAIEINPKYAEALNNLGVLYTQQDKDDEAATLFQQAAFYDPAYSRAFVNLGLTLDRHGQFAEAETQFRAALKGDPNDPAAFAALGMVQAKLGRGEEAIASFRKAVELQPDSSEAHLNLGMALAERFDRAGALKEFSAAIRLDPKSAAAHFNLGRYYFESGNYSAARKELETASTLQAGFTNALYFLALVERQSGNPRRSVDLLQKVVDLQPDQADAQFILGQDLEKLEKPAEAVLHWKLALEADPNLSEALYNLALILEKQGDPQAQQYQRRFDELQKQQQITDRVQQLGIFALEAAGAQNWPQAIEQMREAIQLCGACADAAHLHHNLGLFYCKTGKFKEAEAELRKTLDLDPKDTDARKAIAIVENLRTSETR
jgi:tetratricopeptide (TPR) repeat protein